MFLKDRRPRQIEKIIQDDEGRILGKAVAPGELLRSEVGVVKQFLIRISKGETMSKREEGTKAKKDRCNVVHLAGVIQSVRVEDDGGFFLVDSGPEKKYVPCTIYKSGELAGKLDGFQKGDTIQLVGYVRPWSKKVDDEWQNSMEVRVTEIRNTPPERKDTRQAEDGRRVARAEYDDDIPF